MKSPRSHFPAFPRPGSARSDAPLVRELLRRRRGAVQAGAVGAVLLIGAVLSAWANPVGPTVRQGTATVTSQGNQLTVRASNGAFLEWQSFNIAPGETTTFIEPSATSVVFDQIGGTSAAQLLGALNANGIVVLQDSAGFFVGGQAALHAGGLVLTTTPICPPDFSSGGTWQFNGPPPTASVINYGQISAGPGGSVYLIARDVENYGSITAPGGNIGLYAGQKVLVSEQPDGRGLSARVQLPAGAVDNQGRLIAEAGTILLQAEVVNQGGLIQANSAREQQGVIELVASDSLTLGASSQIAAQGSGAGPSPGGQVTLKSGGSFSDAPGSVISVAGGSQGGQGGQVEISAPQMGAIQSQIDGHAQPGWGGGQLVLDPYNITLVTGGGAASSGTVNSGDPPTGIGSTLTLDPASFGGFSQISLQALNNITVASGTVWNLSDSSNPNSTLTLQAGNNITLGTYSGIYAGRNWSVYLTAGADFATPTSVTSGHGGIYLNSYSAVQTENGSLTLNAGKEVLVRGGAVRTVGGGSIFVEAVSGNVNAGNNPNGYIFDNTTSSGYHVDLVNLGGISTGAGGDVTIMAGQNVISFFPSPTDAIQGDGGSGAFGPEPGVVTVVAGGSVYGHFVAADSVQNGQLVASTITALNGNAGGAPNASGGTQGNPLALSLVTGGWDVNAPNGSINLQEVRNPNGIFDNFAAASPTWHGFDYNPGSFVNLTAGDQVYLMGTGLPRPNDNVPVIYPPSLSIQAGAGGVLLGNSVILFPSPEGELNLTTTGGGGLQTDTPGTVYNLIMSDSGRTQWRGGDDFGMTDHASTPAQLNNPNPVVMNISGNVVDLNIVTPKATQITVGGEMDNTSFVGQNLHPTDVTSITVAGPIWNRSDYTFVSLSRGLTPIVAYPGATPDYLEVLRDAVVNNALAFPNFNFTYDPTTQQLGYRGVMSAQVEQLLLGTINDITYGPTGQPLTDALGNYVTHPATFGVPAALISQLYNASQDIPTQRPNGFQIGGPGTFNVAAASLDLGVTQGIISDGPLLNPALSRLPGANINVHVQGDLTMYSSTIASFFGGNINVYAGGQMTLGSQDILSDVTFARGIYTSGRGGDVTVVAGGDIDVEGSRIAAYNGGNVFVESLQGNVDAGSGASTQVPVTDIEVDATTGAMTVKYQPIVGSGILAATLPDAPITEAVGNVTVLTPRGNISASSGGIVQDPLNGNRSLTPTLTLTAGTRDANGNVVYPGNIDASDSGVIGINTKLNAAGNITGLVISQGTSDISAAANVSGTFFSVGASTLSVGGTLSGIVIAVGGISAAAATVDASMMSSSVNVSGARAESSLPSSATASAASGSAVASAQDESTKTVAPPPTATTGDEDEKKRREKQPVLRRSVGRVTVILPGS